MANPKGLSRPPAGKRYDPTAIDATGATLGHVLTAVSDGSGGQRAGFAAGSGTSGVQVRKNSTGSTFTRSRINLIEGSGVTIAIADDAANDEVDITFTATGGGSSGEPNLYYVAPGSPSAQDDEFTATSLDAKWTAINALTWVFEKDRIIFPTTPGDAKHIIYQTAPATPYAIGIPLTYYGLSGSHLQGLVLRESGTGKLHTFWFASLDSVGASRFSGPGAGTIVGWDVGGSASATNIRRHVWLWMVNDGTNIKTYYSPDGGRPVLYGSYSRTLYMAGGPDQIGIFSDEVLGAASYDVAFHHFRLTPTSTP